jgi:septum formation inhibitor-activating ATPase MinD
MAAWTLARRSLRCTIIDADVSRGGLDVLLGIEAHSGMRFADITAPLGRLDGAALHHELPSWEHVGVLSVDPWNAEGPDWWEQQAAIVALQEVNDLLIIDAGLGEHLADLALPATAQCVLLAELSVLGLARTKALLKSDASTAASDQTLIVGTRPPRMSGRVPCIDIEDAQDYLGQELLGALSMCRRVGNSILSGFGIPRMPRRYTPMLDALADALIEGRGMNALGIIERSRVAASSDGGQGLQVGAHDAHGAHSGHREDSTHRQQRSGDE